MELSTSTPVEMHWLTSNVSDDFLSSPINGSMDKMFDSDYDSSLDNVIFIEHPEDMLNPARRNPMFHEILITHAIAFFVGILGNLVAVSVMVGDRKSRSATNLFLVSLAVADLLLLLLCVPLEVLQYFLQFEDNEFICKMAKYVLLLSASASVLNLCAVSLERFIVIVFPMRSRSLCTLSNCRKAILFVWVAATIISLPVVLTKEGYMVAYTNNITTVKVFYCDEADVGLGFAIYEFMILFAVPGLLMMICYFFVIRELWRSTRNINLLTNSRSFHAADQRPNGDKENAGNGNCSKISRFMQERRGKKKGKEQRKSTKIVKSDTETLSTRRPTTQPLRTNRGEDVKKARKQVIKMLLLVIVLFLICWGPKLIFQIILKLGSIFGVELYTPSMYNTRLIFGLVPFIHSCVNPVIYSFMSKNFRRSMTRQFLRLAAVLGCNCAKPTQPRNTIPLRSVIKTRKLHGPESTFSSNYYSMSEGASTRHTEVHGVTAI